LTMNPAVDLFGVTDELVDDGKSRCQAPSRQAGGGGLNVARNLRRLGVGVLAVFPAGGLNGRQLERMLEEEGLPFQSINTENETRQNLAITEQRSGRLIHFVFPGAPLQAEEWQQCLDAIDAVQPAPQYLVLSGSLPAGVPDDFYARATRGARARGVRVVLDTSGTALAAPMQEGVFLAKLNRREFGDLGYDGPDDYGSVLAAMAERVEAQQAEALIVTLDADGALLASRDGLRLHLRPPKTRVISHVGAGDSFVTVLVYQLQRGLPLREAFQYGVAAAAAKVSIAGNQLPGLEVVEKIYPLVLEQSPG